MLALQTWLAIADSFKLKTHLWTLFASKMLPRSRPVKWLVLAEIAFASC
jgi:hypothetical protein